MIAYQSIRHNSKVQLVNSNGDQISSDNIEHLFNFLLRIHDNQSLKCTWKLDIFVAPLLAKLDRHRLQALYQTIRTWIYPYGITYVPGKMFQVSKGAQKATFYELEQYFNGDDSGDLQSQQEKGQHLLDELAKIKVYPEKLSSPVTVLGQLLDTCSIPTWRNIPDEAGMFAYECSKRPWIEAHKIGHFDTVYDWDMNSAFPGVAMNLLDLRLGRWIYSERIPANCTYGFAYGQLKVKKPVSPFIYVNKSGHLFNPIGTWTTFISKQEIDMLEKWDIGSFKIKEGWWWECKREERPLYGLILKLYRQRKLSPVLDKIIKRAMAGMFYGKFLERHIGSEEFGTYFNPVWGSIVENEARVKNGEFIYKNGIEDKVVHIHTDGIMTTQDLSKQQTSSLDIGQWHLSSQGSALIVNSGTLFYNKKRPKQLNYDEAIEMIKAKPNAMKWSKTIKRKMTLGDIVKGTVTKDKDDLGIEKNVVTGFGIHCDRDRIFARLPRNGKELIMNQYSSKPLKASQLSKPDLYAESSGND
jgi:hypothetical protein